MFCSETKNKEIAVLFRSLREKSGKTQQDVAKFLGLTRTAITQIESGRRMASAWELAGAAELFGVSIAEFYAVELTGLQSVKRFAWFDYNQTPFTC
jgi:DNA-binding XRE family transcriptional regulator